MTLSCCCSCFFYHLSAPQVAAKYTRLFLCLFIFWCRTYGAPDSLKYVLRPLCSGISFPEDYFIDVVYVSVCGFFLVSLYFLPKFFFSVFLSPTFSLQSGAKGSRHALRSKSNSRSCGSLLCRRCHFRSFKLQNRPEKKNCKIVPAAADEQAAQRHQLWRPPAPFAEYMSLIWACRLFCMDTDDEVMMKREKQFVVLAGPLSQQALVDSRRNLVPSNQKSRFLSS